jgi:hypothetical protein
MNYRFRTAEDAQLFLTCYLARDQAFPRDSFIAPFVRVGGEMRSNPEYENAPYEVSLTQVRPKVTPRTKDLL